VEAALRAGACACLLKEELHTLHGLLLTGGQTDSQTPTGPNYPQIGNP
jgi:hypothetical protein